MVRAGVLFILAGAAWAQEEAPIAAAAQAGGGESVTKLEEFTVTGSHIHRLEEEKVLPVTLIGEQAFEAVDAEQPADLLTSLPQVIGAPPQ